jgi:hypothetical protein
MSKDVLSGHSPSDSTGGAGKTLGVVRAPSGLVWVAQHLQSVTGSRWNRVVPQIKHPPATVDLTSPAILKRFQDAAKSFTRRATRSKRAALAALVAEGICTPKGKLTKNYR